MARRAAVPVLLAWLWLGPASCTEYGPRVYTAHPYRVGASCLEDSIPIAVVQAGELKATCEPVCLLLDQTLYVSGVCEPYPARALVVAPEAAGECAQAISLFQSLAFCRDLPSPAEDAGSTDGSPGD